MNELKPCPFCGGEAEFYRPRKGFRVGSELGGVRCLKIKCQARAPMGNLTKENAYMRWNTRHLSLDEVIKLIEAEPETISSSQSFRQGYVRCVRDKVKLLKQKFTD